ncbi:hypothetical protein AVEN_125718-1 [Araneus ventricosus]|uniref:Mos1 transposase HTH domain-containing protein n=1 Tax=Araneus ventricosus TaxID=182803 RepID=A0A4Y2TCT8_ARAVE|nr:hypothetical protein AVEN_125718-1 [Araneus ventricosus]
MFKVIESPAPCDVRSVIRFLSARNQSAADIHRKICEVYGATAMCEGKVRKWVRDFKAGRDKVHDDSRSGRLSVITDDMVASVEAKILENRHFTISTLSNGFLEVSRSVLYKLVSEKLNFKKLCSRWVPKFPTEDHKNKRFECSLNFFTRYNEECDATLSRIITGDETRVSDVTTESKQQSMEWRHTHSPVRVKAKETLSQRKIMASVFWNRHGVFFGRLHATRNYHKCGSLRPNPSKATQSDSKQKTRNANRGNFATP